MLFGNKYKIVFLKNNVEVGRKTFNPKNDSVNFKQGTYPIRLSDFQHQKGRTNHAYVDLDTGQVSLFKPGYKPDVEPRDIMTMIATALAKAGINMNGSVFGLATIIIVAVAGIAGGALIMTIAYPTVFPQMMKPVAKLVFGIA